MIKRNQILFFVTTFIALCLFVSGCNNSQPNEKELATLLFERDSSGTERLCLLLEKLDSNQLESVNKVLIKHNNLIERPHEVLNCFLKHWNVPQWKQLLFIETAGYSSIILPEYYNELVNNWLVSDSLEFMTYLSDSVANWSGNRMASATQLFDAYIAKYTFTSPEILLKTIEGLSEKSLRNNLEHALLRILKSGSISPKLFENHFLNLASQPENRWIVSEYAEIRSGTSANETLLWALHLPKGYCKHVTLLKLAKKAGQQSPGYFIEALNNKQKLLNSFPQQLIEDMLYVFVEGLFDNVDLNVSPEEYFDEVDNFSYRSYLHKLFTMRLRLTDPFQSNLKYYQ